jgi:hypothetical protein
VYGNEKYGDNDAAGLIRTVQQIKDIAIDEDCAIVILHHLTADEAGKLWPGSGHKKPTSNVPPSLDSIAWAKGLRFTADMWLALVPDFQTNIADDMVKLIEWMMKDKRGGRIKNPIEVYYDKIGQWFYDNTSRHLMPVRTPAPVSKPKAQAQVPQTRPAVPPVPVVAEDVDHDDGFVSREEDEWVNNPIETIEE